MPAWNADRPAVEFEVEIGEYQGVVRVPRGVFQRRLFLAALEKAFDARAAYPRALRGGVLPSAAPVRKHRRAEAATAPVDRGWECRSVALAKQLDTFSSAAFAELLSGTDARVWVAQIDGSLVGFLSMIVGSPNPISREPNGAQIPRVYLLPGAQRLGLGRQLLAAAIKQAHDERLTHIWLDVMASADWARRAYLKWGFSELGSKFFDKPVKAGQNDMVVLIKRFSYD
jgi:GNAT superfamily N-acetyltransferase